MEVTVQQLLEVIGEYEIRVRQLQVEVVSLRAAVAKENQIEVE